MGCTTSNAEAGHLRVDEAIESLRQKDVRSTTIERMRVTRDADREVQGLPQPLQFGEGLYYLLDHIAIPVSADDLLLGRILETVPGPADEVFFRSTIAHWDNRAIPPWMTDGGHECFAWDRLLSMGLPGLEAFAANELARRSDAGEGESTLNYLRGAARTYQAFINYARRYALAARRTGLHASAAACEALVNGPPQTFAEALQLMWFIGFVFCTMLTHNATLTFGRMDDLLLHYYRQDLESGRLTREKAGELIEDFYCKNNLILGRGEHQMSGSSDKATGWHRNLCYDAPQYIVVGGIRGGDAASANELTSLFLEKITPRFKNPVVVVRYTTDLPGMIWQSACNKMRSSASMLVYNDACVIPALVQAGVEKEDAITYTMHGCNWPDVPGIQQTGGGLAADLPRYLLGALSGKPQSVDDVYDQFAGQFGVELRNKCADMRSKTLLWDPPGKLRTDDCFLNGPIGRGRSSTCGGVKYNSMICAVKSLATAADSFAALDTLVFSSERVTLERMKAGLRTNFDKDPALRQACIHAPKFGQNDDRADYHAVRIVKTVLEEIAAVRRSGEAGDIPIFPCLETDMGHIRLGARTDATPDGRLAGSPTSENTSPSPGSSTSGLTAMLQSVAKLPLDHITSGALNIRLSPGQIGGPEGLERLADLLRTFYDLGGLQTQISVVDTAELREAQNDPDSYRDLMVRITGYSAAFVDMDIHAQDEIIRREEMHVRG